MESEKWRDSALKKFSPEKEVWKWRCGREKSWDYLLLLFVLIVKCCLYAIESKEVEGKFNAD